MISEVKKANIFSIVGNLFLFIFKLFIGFFTNSIAVISDAMNSFMDFLTTIIVYFCMKVSVKHPDKNHPFGHHMAEPLAAMLIAVLTAVVGFQILQKSFFRFFEYTELNIPVFIIVIYTITLVVKAILYVYTKHASSKTNSEALRALLVDHRNDALISISVIFSFFIARAGFYIIDPIIGFLVAGYIIKSGWDIGTHNIKYVMGETPSPELLDKIKKKACSVKGVEDVVRIRAHYMGLVLHVEIHINVDKKLSLKQAHDIAGRVGRSIEAFDEVKRVFVHIDPSDANLYK